jgi:diguanylate cyclase (GGDEF)-like protein
MTIKKKILLVLAIYFISAIAVTSLISYYVLQKKYLEIERQIVSKNLESVLNTYHNDINELNSVNIDWASWDDTYEFIVDRNEEYLRSNLVDSTFTTLGLNLMLFVDSSGNIVYGKAYDYENDEESIIPEEIYKYISENRILVNNSDIDSGTRGVLLLSDYPILISSEPILTSDDEGPIRGSLIFGRYLKESIITGLSERTESSIDIFRLDRARESSQFKDVLPDLNEETPYYIEPLSGSRVAGYAALKDIDGNPALILRITQQRDFYRQGVATLLFYAFVIFLSFLLLGTISLLVLNRIFLKRLLKIENEVKVIGEKRDISKRINASGNDELSSLSSNINKMLDELGKAQDKIKYLSFHDSLTGIFNRAYFEEELKRLDTERQLPLSLIMGDVNSLKLVNDAFGYACGDLLLCKIAKILEDCCRKEDIVARWGGDEFVMLLPKSTYNNTLEIVNRIKKLCKKESTDKLLLSISLGISTKETPAQKICGVLNEAEDKMRRRKLLESKSLKKSILTSLTTSLLENSFETRDHTIRVEKMALKLGRSINLSGSNLDELSLLATFHDLGKIAIPESILKKKGKLTDKEYQIVKKHPEIGYRIARSSSQLSPVAEAILSHHEHWDGSGYPSGLKKEAIPVISRIIAIVDAYDVMTHDTPYKKACSEEKAVEEIKRCSGTQFDPNLVEKFFRILENEQIYSDFHPDNLSPKTCAV